jgi:hypothetical protein
MHVAEPGSFSEEESREQECFILRNDVLQSPDSGTVKTRANHSTFKMEVIIHGIFSHGF